MIQFPLIILSYLRYAVAKRCLWKTSMFILDQQFAWQNISGSPCPVNITGEIMDHWNFSQFKGPGIFTYCPLFLKVKTNSIRKKYK